MNRSIQHIPAGAVLTRPKALGFIEHEGLYLGNGRVFHNTPASGDHITSIADFDRGFPLKVSPSRPHFVPHALRRAEHLALANKTYHLTDYNCQHSVRSALGLALESPQVRGWALLGAMSLAALALAR